VSDRAQWIRRALHSQKQKGINITSDLMSIRKPSHLAIPSRAIHPGPLCSQPSPPALFAQERPFRARLRVVVLKCRSADHLRAFRIFRMSLLHVVSADRFRRWRPLSNTTTCNLQLDDCCVRVCQGIACLHFEPGAQSVNEESHLNRVGCHSTTCRWTPCDDRRCCTRYKTLYDRTHAVSFERYIRRRKHKTSVLIPHVPHPPDNNRSMLSLINLVLPVKSAFGYLLMTNSLIFLLVTVVRS
jgi:hypothetical protein